MVVAYLSCVNEVFRRPTYDDVRFLIEHIRDGDKLEVESFSGRSVEEVLSNKDDLMNHSYIWERSGKVVCMFGVNPIAGGDKIGVIWLLATQFFDENKHVFTLNCKQVLRVILSDFEYVFNYVHARNKKSLRWIKWLGFTVGEPVSVGVNGEIFHKFEWVNNV